MEFKNQVIKAIHTRRSVRDFEEDVPADEDIKDILEAGTWAPSGLNNQPWRFVVVKDTNTKDEMSSLTHYGHTVKTAPVLICVFMDEDASYDRTKDCMGIGACNQNMLLAAHSMGLGTVWLGEILKNKLDVGRLLGTPETWELLAVIALGYPTPKDRDSKRKGVHELAHLEGFGKPFE